MAAQVGSGDGDHHLVTFSGADLVVATRAAVGLHRLVRLHVADLHLAFVAGPVVVGHAFHAIHGPRRPSRWAGPATADRRDRRTGVGGRYGAPVAPGPAARRREHRMETLVVERADGVVTVTLNRPAKKNAINGAMWSELSQVFDEVAHDPDDRVLVVTGAGDGFCSGADLTDEDNSENLTRGVGGALARMRVVGQAAIRLHELPKPTIAAVNGVAAGAGCNLALGCDLIVASESARFSQIFVQRSLTLDFGGSWILPRLVGLHKAKELAFLGEIISAEKAAEIGIVNRVVPPDDLGTAVAELAGRLAALPPIPLSMMKMALNQSMGLTLPQAVELEGVAQTVNFSSADTAEAMMAFVQKREPRFTGR